MNSERYADPTADTAIGNVMQEWRRKNKYGKERICKDDSRRTFKVGKNRSSEKYLGKTKKKRNERNA